MPVPQARDVPLLEKHADKLLGNSTVSTHAGGSLLGYHSDSTSDSTSVLMTLDSTGKTPIGTSSITPSTSSSSTSTRSAANVGGTGLGEISLHDEARERYSTGTDHPMIDRFSSAYEIEEKHRQKPYPTWFKFVRRHLFKGWLTTTFLCFFLFATVDFYINCIRSFPSNYKAFFDDIKYASIPVVSILFTWWHVWLGIQMCFHPVEFKGCWEPFFGWQGIVPRRAAVMAARACDIMIGNLITIEEIIDRIRPAEFFESLHPVLAEANAKILQKIGAKYWPTLWEKVPMRVKEELSKKALEQSEKLFEPILTDMKENIHKIFDVKEMCIHQLSTRKQLLVDMFQQIGNREFRFIMHVSAVMGFILGCIQLIIYKFMEGTGYSLWILPTSGLIIGYLTNWLGIWLIFKPVHPHIFCFGYLNFQGVFLKRQKQVSQELSKMLGETLLKSEEMIQYVTTDNKDPHGFQRLLEMHRDHTHKAVDSIMGSLMKDALIPLTIGSKTYDLIKNDIVEEMLATMPDYTSEFTKYADRVFGMEATLRERLGNLPPEEFEGMLHPVFEEDEWMILILGGVLGVIVGFLQGLALGA